ncbi:ABC transporter ATP-binding protein [Paracoccus sp. NGMCC 1.201697]|uniref:ABC transporter ATP-binding protein n=1 Tax=Paracoccus broussonetiae subsp. drimophilus TaxID=3373869 RepID=A0ABW7LJQ4_9RHOB
MVDLKGNQISFQSVSKLYNKLAVVDGFTVDIRPGEFFSLLGPSGSGKTTTLMMLAGFTDISSGSITVDGVDISRTGPGERGFGMVFQNYAIFPHLNVYENVAFPLRARKLPRQTIEAKVREALRAVQMEHLAGRFARELSGGQQQRVAIARAISFEPGVVLMDEPLGALDKNLRYAMQIEIKELQRRLGLTVIYVTHDQEEAMNMSDRIAIMANGAIAQMGPPLEVYESPRSRFIARFLGEANVIEGKVARLADGEAAVEVAGLKLGVDGAGELPSPGEECAFFVRPERLKLSVGAALPGYCHVPGRVEKIAFLGNITRYEIDWDGPEGFVIDCANSDDSRHAHGQPVFVNWNRADAKILTR